MLQNLTRQIALARSRTDVTERAPGKILLKAKLQHIGRAWMFRLMVLVPTLVTTLYYGVIAAPRYVSVSQFIVRSVNNTHMGGFDAFFRTFGISRAVDDTNVVENYILSRDAVTALQKQLDLRQIFESKKADFIAAYPPPFFKDSNERLFRYYLNRVSVVQNTTQGIATLRVEAFGAKSAHAIAVALMHLAEGMVNQLNDRAQRDTVKSAVQIRRSSEQKLLKTQADLTLFRNSYALVDPDKNSVADLQTISSLANDLAHTVAQMQQNSVTSPSSPQNSVLSSKAKALKQAITGERARIAGGKGSLVDKIAEYDQLKLNRDIAQKSYESAVTSLESARQEARSKQIYLEEVVRPSLPDVATEPRSLRMIMTVFAFSFGLYAVAWLLTVGVREHAQ